MNLGKRTKQARILRGLEQQQLADLVGVPQQTISMLETRDSKTSDYAIRIADALQVSLRWLLAGVGDMDAKEWLFDRVDRARWEACDEGDRGYVQHAINRALQDCEAQRAASVGKASSPPGKAAAA